jgi:hypothetical protein
LSSFFFSSSFSFFLSSFLFFLLFSLELSFTAFLSFSNFSWAYVFPTSEASPLLWAIAEATEHKQWRGTKAREPKPKLKTKDNQKALFSTVEFWKDDPLYKCRSVSFYREADGLFTFRGYPRVKRI